MKLTKKEFFEQGQEDGKSNRHIEDLCQCFWSSFIKFCDNGLFSFDVFVKAFPSYKRGIEHSRKLKTI